MTIASILHGKGTDTVSVTPETTVAAAVALLAERRIGAVPVMDGETVVGIFSERDVIHCLRADGAAALDRPVGAGDDRAGRKRGARFPGDRRAVADDAAAHPASARDRWRARRRLRVDRRSGEISHRPDRGGCGGDARLYPVGLSALHDACLAPRHDTGSGCLRTIAIISRSVLRANSNSHAP